jgi:hypothetical protein
MKLRIDTIPTNWNGSTLGIYRENDTDEGIKRNLESYLAESLYGAHLSGYQPNGQPKPPETKDLLARGRLRQKLDNGPVITIDDDEFTLFQTCVSSYFPELASVAIITAIHGSVQPEVDENKGD